MSYILRHVFVQQWISLYSFPNATPTVCISSSKNLRVQKGEVLEASEKLLVWSNCLTQCHQITSTHHWISLSLVLLQITVWGQSSHIICLNGQRNQLLMLRGYSIQQNITIPSCSKKGSHSHLESSFSIIMPLDTNSS